MKILGAGLAGCLAAIEFPNAEIEEYLDEPARHTAVLRFRSDDISKFTGIPFKKVTVHKGIFSAGKFVDCNIKLANQYSRKVSGFTTDRSIWNTDPVERWIAPNDFHDQLLAMCEDRISTSSGFDFTKRNEDIISTLPMVHVVQKVGITFEVSRFSKRPIYTSLFKVHCCDVYQTIYFPSNDTCAYRATLTSNNLIIESVVPISDMDVRVVTEAFSVSRFDKMDMNVEMPNGKITYPDVEQTKGIVFDLTSNHHIYSLGRSALMKNILLDDTLQDIHRIKEMMVKTSYQKRLGK